MKLGNGKYKFKFKFIYNETKRTSIKYVYADNFFNALDLFNECYKNYSIEINDVKKLEEGESDEKL